MKAEISFASIATLHRLLCCCRFRARSIATLTILCLSSFQLVGQTTSAGEKALIVPPLVNYSGVLQDSAGKPLSGAVSVTFYIYKDSQGGTPLWTETQNLQVDGSGHYSVMLGSTTNSGLPEDLFAFGEPRWIGLQVLGEAEQPRALLVAVPYALKAADAATIGGLPPSAFLRAAPYGTSSSSLAQPSESKLSAPTKVPGACLALSGSGTINFLPIWTSLCVLSASTIFQSGGLTGIGTNTPGAKLDVLGDDSNPQASGMQVSTPTFPQYLFNATHGLSNAKIWRMIGRGTNDFEIQTLNDSYGGEVTAMQIIRSGTSISNVQFPNGDVLIGNNVGIGTTNPAGARLNIVGPDQKGLFIEGPVSGIGAGLQLIATGATQAINWEILATGLGAAQGYGKLNFRRTTSSGFQDILTLDAGIPFTQCFTPPCVGIAVTSPTNPLQVGQGHGHVLADGYDTYSSRRWKTNIHTLEEPLQKVEQLRGVSYDDVDSNKHEIGVIAEEVGAVVPEIVSWEENGKDARGVDYARLTALLIEAVKQQQHEIEGQQAQLADALRQIRQDEALLHSQAMDLAGLKAELRATSNDVQKVKQECVSSTTNFVAAIRP